ncbi:CidA/LrgA family protein [Bacillus songklensis]|uniref:CidA/LrgA family protein n=1 Tax=Bacillus songklensis TaxID=1069116 RepID=A0ABV8B5B3_9BACI
MKIFTILLQMILLTVIFLLGEGIVRLFHLPVPGSIIGLAILFLLLQLKIIKLSWIEKGGNLLLANLLLFFIPAVVGLINYTDVIKQYGIQIMAVIVVSTVLVMSVTGLVAELVSKRKEEKSA